MKYILSGKPSEVANVIRENGLRVKRGVIEFTPIADAEAADDKDVAIADDKTVTAADDKTPKAPKRTKKSE